MKEEHIPLPSFHCRAYKVLWGLFQTNRIFNIFIRILFFFTLLLDEPIQELHGAEVMNFKSCRIDGVDGIRYILFMFQAFHQWYPEILIFLVWRGNLIKNDGFAVIQ